MIPLLAPLAAVQPDGDAAALPPRKLRPRLAARLLFAAIGALACLLAALALEGVFSVTHTREWLDKHDTPVLLFVHHVHGETERRLREANAQTGDVEIVLTWNNLNDLDLYCLAPNNELIFFNHKVSPATGGRLDVDRNMSPPYTQQPVEHIYWPHGRAPAGRYRVYVHHYSRHGSMDPTHYQMTVKEYGHVKQYSGDISHEEARPPGVPGKLICEFTSGRPTFELLGLPTSFWVALLVVAAWAAILATALRFALRAGLHLFYRRVYRQRLVTPGKAVPAAVACALWSAFGGGLAQTAFAFPSLEFPMFDPNWGHAALEFQKIHPTWSHAAGFAILATIVGLAVGGPVPHLKRSLAFLAGVAGGALAGGLFLVVYWRLGESSVSELGGRVAAAALIGGLIGFMIALIVEEPEPPEPPVEFEDDALDGMQPLSLRANRMGPTGKLRRAGREPAHR